MALCTQCDNTTCGTEKRNMDLYYIVPRGQCRTHRKADPMKQGQKRGKQKRVRIFGVCTRWHAGCDQSPCPAVTLLYAPPKQVPHTSIGPQILQDLRLTLALEFPRRHPRRRPVFLPVFSERGVATRRREWKNRQCCSFDVLFDVR
jgi:hypothetical protein